jgi:hypothetical protein
MLAMYRETALTDLLKRDLVRLKRILRL